MHKHSKATSSQEFREELLMAMARGYTHKVNANKELDSDLIKAMVEEVLSIISKERNSMKTCKKDCTRYAVWAIVAYLAILSFGVIALAISVNALWA